MDNGIKKIGGAVALCLLIAWYFVLYKPEQIVKADWTDTVKQSNPYSCGAASLKMLLAFRGKNVSIYNVIKSLKIQEKKGATLLGLKQYAQAQGIQLNGYVDSSKDLHKLTYPAILLVGQNHYVVLDSVNHTTVFLRDPLYGRLNYDMEILRSRWSGISLQLIDKQ